MRFVVARGEDAFRARPNFATQLKAIKSAALHILEHIGVRFPSERALRVFAEHGARTRSGKKPYVQK